MRKERRALGDKRNGQEKRDRWTGRENWTGVLFLEMLLSLIRVWCCKRGRDGSSYSHRLHLSLFSSLLCSLSFFLSFFFSPTSNLLRERRNTAVWFGEEEVDAGGVEIQIQR